MKKLITLIAASFLLVGCVSVDESPYETQTIDEASVDSTSKTEKTPTDKTSVLTYYNGGAGTDRLTAVKRDSSGNYYFLGHTSGDLFDIVDGSTATGDTDSSLDDIIFVKLDLDGNVVCEIQTGSSYSDATYGNSLVVNDDYIYIGYSYSNGSDRVAILAQFNNPSSSSDCAASLVTQVEIDSSDGGDEDIKALLEDSNGNIYAVGQTSGTLESSNEGSEDFFVKKYSSDLSLDWTYQGGSSAADIATAGVMTTDGFLIVAGYTSGDFRGTNEGGTDAVYVKIRKSSGSLTGGEQFGTSGDETQVNVFYDVDGYSYINILGQVGASETMNDTDFTLGETFNATYSSSGTHQTTYSYCGTGTSDSVLPVPAAVDSSGRYYIQTLGSCDQLYSSQMPSKSTTQYLLKTTKRGSGLGGYAHSGGNFTIYAIGYDTIDGYPLGAGSYFEASDGSTFGGSTVDSSEDAVGGQLVTISNSSGLMSGN
ncbi:MAG: hypothetical protein QNL04_02145 [SAR324 cluster bacterium]|nr:hypothetical protein [SAR324 cluster bacterium]